MSSDNLTADHYQELVDRGWRRSGTTYYKPDLPRSCCPHYTIRLDSHGFKAKKEQRKAINRWNNFVLGTEYRRKAAMLCPQSRDIKKATRGKFDVVTAVHKSEFGSISQPLSKKDQKPIEPAHRFEVSLEADKFTEEKHQVFLRYQKAIHKDPEWRWKEDSFTRFLCSGLSQQTLKIGGKVLKLGSYHQCYRLDGRLVAVGVLDLLPHAVSSVYLFYDPDFQEWDFGKMSALREIALAIEKQYDWYYMDPEMLNWNLLDGVYRDKLHRRAYVSPSRDARLGEDAPPPGPAGPRQRQGASKEDQPQRPVTDSVSDGYEFDSEPSDLEDTDIPEGSLFDYEIPGVLSKEEVKKLDLDHWKLLVRNMLVDFEDIRGWEAQSIDDSSDIKGIIAELAATIGPKLLKNSAVVLF